MQHRSPIELRREAITSEVAQALIGALNAELRGRYPEDGTACHFRLDPDEVAPGRGVFLVMYAAAKPLGCGGLRMLDRATAEIKRMYIEPGVRGQGLGRRLLAALEAEARSLGATRVLLETGPRQPEAIALYTRAGFAAMPAFGEYVTHPLSVFMGKELQ
jgi:GNAT superfamily N-acetyltransferase